MEMLWTDLEAGDLLKLNPEFDTAFNNEFGRRASFYDVMDSFINNFFKIVRIDRKKHKDMMIIELNIGEGSYNRSFRICNSNGALFKFPNGPTLFKVFGLKE